MKCNDIDNIKKRVDREVQVYKQVVRELSSEEITKMGGMDYLLDRIKTNIINSIAWSFKEEGNA